VTATQVSELLRTGYRRPDYNNEGLQVWWLMVDDAESDDPRPLVYLRFDPSVAPGIAHSRKPWTQWTLVVRNLDNSLHVETPVPQGVALDMLRQESMG
jgi:hypothetical protein